MSIAVGFSHQLRMPSSWMGADRVHSCCFLSAEVFWLWPFEKSRFQGHRDEAEGVTPVDLKKAIKVGVFLTENGRQLGKFGSVACNLMAKRSSCSTDRSVFTFVAVDTDFVEVDTDGFGHWCFLVRA